ncbi:MAG: O-antigen ligase family protein [Deltaproteobacteria bacterium]|nr:O-antigen ligase family protein [Deltaproteobacteria bacterium]
MDTMREHLRSLIPSTPGALGSLEVISGSVLTFVLIALILVTSPKVVLAGILAIVGGLYFFARPAVSLVAVFMGRVLVDLLWWIPGSFGGLNVLEAFGGGVAALAAVLFYLELRRVERQPGFLPLLIYLGVMAIAVVRSGEVRDAAEILAKYVSPLLLMFLVSTLMDDDKRRRQFVTMVTAAGLVSLSVSVYHLATGQRFQFFRQGYYRLHGGYGNLHNHALFLLFLNALLFFWFMTSERRWQKVLSAGLMAVGMVCLYFTFVRTALTGVAAFVVIYLVLEKRWGLLGLAGLAGVLFLLSSETLQDRFSDIIAVFGEGDEASKRTLGSGRFGIWTMSVREYLHKSPLDILLGLGLGGHYEVTDAYADLYRSTKKSENLDSHNDYLTLLFQLGPIAVACYVWLQVIVIQHGLELHRWAKDHWDASFGRYMVAMCVVVFVTNALSNSFVQRVTVAWLFWGMVGVLFALHRKWSLIRAAEERERAAAEEATRALGRALG